MRKNHIALSLSLLLLTAFIGRAQVTLNTSPSRVVGQPGLTLNMTAPNLVEGRELSNPQAVAVDTSTTSPALYVSDTGNNRVLAWRNASQFANGAPADLIIGQPNRFTTARQGPGTSFSAGLAQPTGLAVRDGNLFVVDTGNNRILRFPRPFSKTEQLPDLVIGQPNFNSSTANTGGLSNRSIAVNVNNSVFRASLAFDSEGNLYFADSGNNRVLRYPASAIGANASSGPAANLVLGQFDFENDQYRTQNSNNDPRNAVVTLQPSGVALDPAGRLFVSDGLNRVLVYLPPFSNGKSASRFLGVIVQVQGQPPPPPASESSLRVPEGVFMIGSSPAVADSGNNRILRYDPFDQWTGNTFVQPARSLIGQDNFAGRLPNTGQAEASSNRLSAPADAFFVGNELFVADSGNHRLLVFPQTSPGSFPSASRVLGQDQFEFNSVNLIEGRELRFITQTAQGTTADAGLVVDPTSDPPHLYIADTYNNRILGYRDFRKVRPGDRADLIIGQPDPFRSLCNYPSNDIDKPTDSSLCAPVGLALDREGNLYVADSGNGRVLRFPKPFEQPQQRANLVIGQTSFTSKITDPTARTMRLPYGLAFAGENGLLVSDAFHNRVLFFPGNFRTFSNGMVATRVFGQPDFTSSAPSIPNAPADNRMSSPRHISTDSDDRLYVADAGNSRIQIFNRASAAGPDPLPGRILTNTTQGQGTLSSPRGVFVNQITGEIWVADTGSGRAFRYPNFDRLILSSFADFAIQSATPLALTQDAFGDLYVADAANRVAIYFPGVAAFTAANALPRALAPGAIASLYPLGNSFGDSTAGVTALPLPRELSDIQLLVNDQPAPLFFVSPGQINFMVPMSAPTSGTIELQVIRRSTGQILGSSAVPVNVAAPALFTQGSTGTGQIAALNQDNTVNSPANPAARGTIVSLYATGQGFVPGAPPDGTPPEGLVSTPEKPRVIVNTGFVDDNDVQFSGLAPGFPGLWQINVRIPMTVPPGNAIVVFVVHKDIPSNNPQNPAQIRTTIAVKQ